MAMTDLPPLDVGIIGAGRAGTAVAVALARAGAAVCLVARNADRQAALIHYFEGHELDVDVTDDHAAALARPYALFATADRDLDAAAEAAQRGAAPSRIWLHLSGVASPDVLDPGGRTRAAGVFVGSCHPLCAILDPLALPADDLDLATRPLRGAFFAIAGDAPAADVARHVATACGGDPHDLAVAHRAAYHAAATVVANDLVALLHVGETLVAQSGLDPLIARRALVHLSRTAVDAVQDASCAPGRELADGLTGAVGRGDAVTLTRHLDALTDDAHGRESHRLLSAVLFELVRQRLPEDARQAVAEALGLQRLP